MFMEIRRQNEAFKGQHDLFISELKESDEPLQTIATLMGRGLVTSH